MTLRDYNRSSHRKAIYPSLMSLLSYMPSALLIIIVLSYFVNSLRNGVYILRLSRLASPFGRQSAGDKLLTAYV